MPPTDPHRDGLDRDAFYAGSSEKPPPHEPEDDDYELEPIDEHVLAQERARARAEIVRAKTAINIDEVYRQIDTRDDLDYDFEAFKPRFSLKTLLIATTGLALLLGVWQGGLMTGNAFSALIVLSLVVLSSLHAWLNWRDARRRADAQAERERQRARDLGEEPDMYSAADTEVAAGNNSPAAWLAAALRRARFGTSDLLLATLAAAVLMTFVQLLGGMGRAAAAMGVVAVAGFAIQAANYHPPRFLVLAWWFALAAFCLLTLASLFAASFTAPPGAGG